MKNMFEGAFASAYVDGKVFCDDCSADYTGSDKKGGLLFQSKAICPSCQKKWEDSAKKYKEERFIRARCPTNKTFYNWVVEDLR